MITWETSGQVITGVNPDTAFPGQTLQITISGSDLFFTPATNTTVWLSNGTQSFQGSQYTSTPEQVNTNFQIPQAAGLGFYDVIVGSLASPTAQMTNGFEVVAPPPVPNAPQLSAPANGSVVTQNPVTFSWNAVGYAHHYEYQFSEEPGFTDVIYTDHTTALSVPYGFANGQYFWRVRARNYMMEYGPWSEIRSLNMDGLVSLTSITPNEGHQGQSLPVTISGVNIGFEQATALSFQLVQNANAMNINTFGISSLVGINLEYTGDGILDIPTSISTGLYDLLFTDNTNTQYSLIQSFNVLPEVSAPNQPLLTQPVDNEVLTTANVSFDWTDVANAGYYQLQLSATPGFTNPVLDINYIEDSEYQTSLLGGSYFWRVKAFSVSQNGSAWSNTETFELDSVSFLTSMTPNSAFAGVSELSLTVSGVNLPFSGSTNTQQSLWLQQGSEQIDIEDAFIFNPTQGTGELTIPVQSSVGYYDLYYQTPTQGPYQLPNAFYVNGGNAVQGTVFIDYNENGVFDGIDQPYPYGSITNGNGAVLQLSGTDGSYAAIVPSGAAELQLIGATAYNVSPASHNVNFSGSGSTLVGNDFALVPIENIDDASVSFVIGQIREGRNVGATLTITNVGTVPTSGQAQLVLPEGMSVEYSAELYSQNSNVITWEYSNALPLSEHSIHMILYLEVDEYEIGDLLDFQVSALNANLDEDLSNNAFVLQGEMVNSYDPNIKQVSPATIISEEFVSNEEALNYTIFFQNTGNAPAIDVYILDTISENLDLNTLQYVSASHNCEVTVLDNRVVEFRFDDVNLPDSTTSPTESIGHVNFRIKPITSFTTNMVIQNTVGIYFDFNQPIITNTTENWIPTSINELTQVSDLVVAPNPATDLVQIYASDMLSVQIFDSLGKQVYFRKGNVNGSINLESLAKGVYLVRVETERGLDTRKLIVR